MPLNEEKIAEYCKKIEDEQEAHIDHLREWVEIPSISSSCSHRSYCHQMLEHAMKEYQDLGAHMELHKNPSPKQVTPEGEEIDYPGIVIGNYPAVLDENKPTVLIYGHLDVQPAKKSDGWDTEPFEMIVKDGKMYGRGSTDDKGPVLGWWIALKTMKELGMELPVNLKFCFEGMEESGSVGLSQFVFETQADFFKTVVDGTIVSDNYWLGLTKPCLTYGLRGIAYFQLVVECAKQDLHSGVYGGTIHEAMTDMVQILGSLVDNKGKIQIEGIYDQVDALTDEENKLYTDIEFSQKEFAEGTGTNLCHDDKILTLQNRWRNPALSIHGMEGAFYEPGEKTVIPRKVIGKFSIRTVPAMMPDYTVNKVKEHIEKMKKSLNTPNNIYFHEARGCEAWYGNPSGPLYEAAKLATERVYGQTPDFTREGGSIPIVLDFQRATNKPVCMIPMGSADDGAHSQNEKLNIRNYIEGTKLLGISLLELEGRLTK